MLRSRSLGWLGYLLIALGSGSASAEDISGTISTTLTISENSSLVGDVICTVTGAPCVAFGASGLTLDLNGFSMTGLGDPLTGCAGGGNAGEFGIDVNAVNNAVIRGLGLVRQFRNQGIRLNNSTGATVSGVTMSTNCFSGIILIGGSGHLLENNISVKNGNATSPCGGI
jgi:Periplasmic copper-binding protein (NosD)